MRFLFFTFIFSLVMPASLLANKQEIQRLKSLVEDAPSRSEKADIYAQVGLLYTESNMDSTLHYGTLAWDLSQELNDEALKARALKVLAFYYMERGNSYLSYKFAQEALTIFQQHGLSEQEAEMLMNIGVMLLNEGKLSQANQHIEQAFSRSEELESDSIQALILLNLVLPRYQEMGAMELESNLNKIAEIANRHNNQRVLLILEHFKAHQQLRSSQPTDSLRSQVEELLLETQRAGHDYLAIPGYMELAQAYLQTDLEATLNYIDKAVELAENGGFESLQINLLNHALQMLTNLTPIPHQANHYADNLQELVSSRMETHQKDGLGYLEIAMREQELAGQQREVEIRQMWSVIAAISGIVALLVAFWILWQYRIRRKILRKLEQTSAELMEKNRQLEANDHFNTRLISVLSHDLRHPFTSVLMMSGELLSDLEPAEQQIVYKDIVRSAAVSLQVIDGLLHWMKLQTISMAYTPSAVGIRENMEQAATFYELDINRRQIRMEINMDPSLKVLAQREMLLFVNRNIISNAVKYSPQGGIVRLEAFLKSDDRVLVSISDEGPGMTDEVLQGLFFKGKNVNNHQAQQGAGLAMIICYEMIVGMGGRIHARNRTDRSGAIFEYELPLFIAETTDNLAGKTTDLKESGNTSSIAK